MKNGKQKTIKHAAGHEQELKKQVEEYKNKYLRALADYHNLEKRIEQKRGEQRGNEAKRLLLNLLPFLDNLEKAEVFLKDEGLKIIKNEFQQTLEKEGLKEMDLVGHEYDPHFAEALEVVEGNKDNVITEVVRKGYMLGDQILRVAQVKVSKKS